MHKKKSSKASVYVHRSNLIFPLTVTKNLNESQQTVNDYRILTDWLQKLVCVALPLSFYSVKFNAIRVQAAYTENWNEMAAKSLVTSQKYSSFPVSLLNTLPVWQPVRMKMSREVNQSVMLVDTNCLLSIYWEPNFFGLGQIWQGCQTRFE